jgi:hypothetical protein
MPRIFGRGRYANVTSTMALIVALGGTAYAANTIRSSDIVNGQVKRVDIANNAVTSGKVANNSLRVNDFRASDRALLRGPAGAAGLPGATGATGAPGAKGDPGTPGADATTLFAAGDADGSLQRSSGGVSVNKFGTGLYRLTFPESVEGCVAIASIGATTAGNNTQSGGAAATINPSLGVGVTTVRTAVGATATDLPWATAVFC